MLFLLTYVSGICIPFSFPFPSPLCSALTPSTPLTIPPSSTLAPSPPSFSPSPSNPPRPRSRHRPRKLPNPSLHYRYRYRYLCRDLSLSSGAKLPQSCRRVAAELPQSCRRVAAELPQSCRRVATELPQSCRRVAAELPQSCRLAQANNRLIYVRMQLLTTMTHTSYYRVRLNMWTCMRSLFLASRSCPHGQICCCPRPHSRPTLRRTTRLMGPRPRPLQAPSPALPLRLYRKQFQTSPALHRASHLDIA